MDGIKKSEALQAAVALQDLSDRYKLGKLLGEGRFSKVFAATPTAPNTQDTAPVALKEIELEILEEDDEALEMLEAEVAALKHAFSHAELGDAVVKLHEIVRTNDCIFLVLDRVPGEELFNVIDAEGVLALPMARVLMIHLLKALAALHKLGIVHRDVKPENLMVSGLESPTTARLTLIDFGYADVKGGGTNLTRLAGSPEYAAPEVLSWLSEDGDPYDARCDVWSVGITAHVLISGELPFDVPEDADEDAIADIARSATLNFEQEIWAGDGMDAPQAFLRTLLQPIPNNRPTAQAALLLPWLDEEATTEPVAERPAAEEVTQPSSSSGTASVVQPATPPLEDAHSA